MPLTTTNPQKVLQLLDEFNKSISIGYNKLYEEHQPDLKGLVQIESSGFSKKLAFYFTNFLKGIEKTAKGEARNHFVFPDSWKFEFTHDRYTNAIDVPVEDIEQASRLQTLGMGLQDLATYARLTTDLAMQAKDHPLDLALELLEAGAGSSKGLAYDGQYFFDTDHSYRPDVAGSQSNIVTGTGTSLAQLKADLLSVISRFSSFNYDQTGASNWQKKPLNKSIAGKIFIIAPTQMAGALYELKYSKSVSSTGEDNTVRNAFDYMTQTFSDTNDWYAILIDQPTVRPIIVSIEKPAVLDYPQVNDFMWKENQLATYGLNGRWTAVYGAWWKAIKVTNA